MSLWQERALRNEEVFRAVNDDIARLQERFGGARVLAIVCECSDPSCTERITIDAVTYEDVRSHAMRFVVAPGHEDPAVETVVADHASFLVVEKHLDDDE